MKKSILLFTCFIASCMALRAQTFTDITVGVSNQDRVSLNLAVRKQFSDRFRAGIELQSSIVDYRFIGAKLIDRGNSTTISLPSSLRLYQTDKIRLDFYSRIGVRFQNVEENYAKEKLLQDNSSVGFNVEPGLAVTVLFSDKFNIQSGFTLPNVFEISPEFLYENNATNIFANLGYKVSDKTTFIFKANAGPAAGANGDSQKFNWAFQTGLRFAFGKGDTAKALMIDPTY